MSYWFVAGGAIYVQLSTCGSKHCKPDPFWENLGMRLIHSAGKEDKSSHAMESPAANDCTEN